MEPYLEIVPATGGMGLHTEGNKGQLNPLAGVNVDCVGLILVVWIAVGVVV